MVTFSLPAQDEEQVVRIVLVADHGLAGPKLPDPDVALDLAEFGWSRVRGTDRSSPAGVGVRRPWALRRLFRLG